MLFGKSKELSDSSTENTLGNILQRQEQPQSQIMSTLQRNELKARLNNFKIEIEAVLRMLARNDVDISNDNLEKLLLRQSQLLDTALNPK